MKRKSRPTVRSETLVVKDWVSRPTKVILGTDAVVIQLPDDVVTLFKEGTGSLELYGEGGEYSLRSGEGTVPSVSMALRVLGRNLLITMEEGSVPRNLSTWIMMKTCSCHLVFTPAGAGYRKYILEAK